MSIHQINAMMYINWCQRNCLNKNDIKNLKTYIKERVKC